VQAPNVQPSVVAIGQVAHEPAPVPQAFVDCDSQAFPLQHPFGHEAALQTHVPPTQACPIAHC
jgi:hypothetical protein